MIEHTPEIKALAKSLSSFQFKVHGVETDSTNPHFKNRYASLEAVINAARNELVQVGLTFTQAPGVIVNGAIEVTTMIIHCESGQWLRSTLHVPLDKTTAQGAGSAITYGCRYALMATLGLPPLDDDAEGVVRRARKQEQEHVVEEKPAPAARDNITGEPMQPKMLGEPAATEATQKIINHISGCVTSDELNRFWKSEQTALLYEELPRKHQDRVKAAAKARSETLKARVA